MGWSVETVAAADSEIEALPIKLRARMVRLLEMVENVGLDQLREPHVRHLEGKLWELRAKSRDGIARGIYVTATAGASWFCTCLSRLRGARRGKRQRRPRNG